MKNDENKDEYEDEENDENDDGGDGDYDHDREFFNPSNIIRTKPSIRQYSSLITSSCIQA
jgi:hypothetical protein